MNIEPIAKTPEYAKAAARLAEYRATLAKAKDEANRLAIEAVNAQNRKPETAADVLKEADALLAGDDPARADVAARQAKNARLVEQLRKAEAIQETELRRITDELSAKARKAAHAEYAPLVERVRAALEVLVAANKEVATYCEEFDALGYRGLISYTFALPGGDSFDPHNRADAFCAGWWGMTERYVQHGLLPHERLPMPAVTPAAKLSTPVEF